MSASTASSAETSAPGSTPPRRRRHKAKRLSTFYKVALGLMAGIPTVVVVAIVWLPALATVGLSFTDYDGFKPLSSVKNVGMKNFKDVTENYPPFWPALQHNLMWLGVTFLIPTVLGICLAVLLDREIKFS